MQINGFLIIPTIYQENGFRILDREKVLILDIRAS